VKLFVYHTPELTPTDRVPDCAIVIDVLRATSTIATALHAGAEAVQVFSDLDLLMQTSEQWPAEKRIRAGERGGKQVEGYDFGNSPLDCTPERVKGCRIFMSTTNGTRALQRVEAAPMLVTAALVNRQRVVQQVLSLQNPTVWMVGSGWEGGYSLEDTVCAGAIVHALQQSTGTALLDLAGNDEVVAATALFEQWHDRLLELLRHASHGQRLLRISDHLADLKFCAALDQLDVLPLQREPGVLVSHAS
jgi:2-phosphosulfolactate phosphatase